MVFRYQTDVWRPGIVHAPLSELLACTDTRSLPITWLPDQRDFAYLADPFGLWHHDSIHVFVEAYDYRTKKGVIRRFAYDKNFRLQGDAIALDAPFHLSYPYLIQHSGHIYMLPEAHQSGRLTLYRAKHFPDGWEPVCDLLDQPAIDPSLVHYDGRWWLFYSLPGPDRHAESALYVAWSDNLTGPWTAHERNPVQRGLSLSRPGGTPFVVDGQLMVPVQDCSRSYGGAINILHVSKITPSAWQSRLARRLTGENFSGAWLDGLHTLSECDSVTLIDCKRIEDSPRRALVNLQRRWQKWTAQV